MLYVHTVIEVLPRRDFRRRAVDWRAGGIMVVKMVKFTLGEIRGNHSPKRCGEVLCRGALKVRA